MNARELNSSRNEPRHDHTREKLTRRGEKSFSVNENDDYLLRFPMKTMSVESFELQRCFVMLYFFHCSFLAVVQSVTVAHQLPIEILPPIGSKQQKTLWIGGE